MRASADISLIASPVQVAAQDTEMPLETAAPFVSPTLVPSPSEPVVATAFPTNTSRPSATFVLPTLAKTPVENLPDNVVIYTLPSRHCPSDLFLNDAWQLFGHIEGGRGLCPA